MGHDLEETVGTQPLPLPALLPSHEVSNDSALLCLLAIGPKLRGHPIKGWYPHNWEVDAAFSLLKPDCLQHLF